MENLKEIWKEIPNYEGLYWVSNLGNVKSKNKKLKPYLDRYYFVNLYKNKKAKSRRIHVLVAEAFLNHKPDKQLKVIDHIDNNKTNNLLSNLQIINSRENANKNKKLGISGVRGVCWSSQNKKWQVRLRINNKKINIGYYDNKDYAGKIYLVFVDIIEKLKLEKLNIDDLKGKIIYYKNILKELK